jgi:nicotinate-nucleotide pyrophosphorylase (carboxylating)
VELLRAAGPRVLVEVEVAPDADLAELATVDADILMFDNWPADRLKQAIRKARYFPRRPLIEVSGRIRLDNVRRIALCGPDFISVGYITHSAAALDISLDLEP